MKIIAVTNRKLCRGNFLHQIERLANAAVSAVILREKDISPQEYFYLAQQCQRILQKQEVPLVINHYVDIARQLKIPAVQVSYREFLQQKEPLKQFSSVLVSVHTTAEAQHAANEGAHGLIAGHIFTTDCKKNLSPKGVAFLEEICHTVSVPVYAIGGITADTISLVQKSGITGVCVMSQAMLQEKFFWQN